MRQISERHWGQPAGFLSGIGQEPARVSSPSAGQLCIKHETEI
jgi:hypothetical protein